MGYDCDKLKQFCHRSHLDDKIIVCRSYASSISQTNILVFLAIQIGRLFWVYQKTLCLQSRITAGHIFVDFDRFLAGLSSKQFIGKIFRQNFTLLSFFKEKTIIIYRNSQIEDVVSIGPNKIRRRSERRSYEFFF